MAISNETREEFTQQIYDMFADDGSNDKANQIIDIFNITTESCVEPPCKVGDTVYFPIRDRFNSATIDEITITKNGLQFYWIQYDNSYETTEIWDDGTFSDKDIGKTVFLTREAAEQALRENNNA